MSEPITIGHRTLDALVSAKVIDQADADAALAAARESATPLGDVLAARKLVTTDTVAEVLEDALGVPRVDLASYAPDAAALRVLPAELAREHGALPLFEIEGMLTVAIGDPMDVFGLDELADTLGLEVEAVLADGADVSAAIESHYAGADEGAEADAASFYKPVELEPVEPVDQPQSVADPSLSADDFFDVLGMSPDEAADIAPLATDAAFDLALDLTPEAAKQAQAADEVSAVVESVEAEAEAEGGPSAPEAIEDIAEDAELIELARELQEEMEEAGIETEASVEDLDVATEAPDVLAEDFEAVAEVSVEAITEEAELVSVAADEIPACEEPSGIDLDVLAVADDRRVAVLVSDILELAVARGANRIHVLPYKRDFFVVLRVHGRLEKIASAPVSMQNALVEGFKSFARLSSVPSTLPAVGRLRTDIAGRQVVLIVSAVPTIGGQRLVVSIGADNEPRTLDDLGMTEAEVRAMHAMVERGRGMLLVAGPISGGRSTTYYALLSHAARMGKTVYSVERTTDYEIPAVAQVLVNPGSQVGPASYLAAGLRQDTDIIAIDSMQTVEEIHLAVEAAGMGKLVIATFAGADIAAAVGRMLELGAEPVSLAQALTLGVGQRVVRTNCHACLAEEPGDLAGRIPGAPADLVSLASTGCDECGSSGFAGTTGIFEVLPFTEAVRSTIAAAGSRDDIRESARAAGMRPLAASGLAKVTDGILSAAELDRVLRFSEQS